MTSKVSGYLHEIPPDRLLGEGPALDVPKGPNEDIMVRDLEATGRRYARETSWPSTPDGIAATLRRGKIGTARTSTSPSTGGLCTESAQWLVERGVATVLIDTPAIDSAPHTVFGDETWQAHAGLFEHNIPVVEHLGGEIDEVASRALYYQLRACEVRVWGRVPPPGAGVVP